MEMKKKTGSEGVAEFSIFRDNGTIIKRQYTILPPAETDGARLGTVHRGLSCKVKFKNAGQYDSTWECSGNVSLPCVPEKLQETWDWVGEFLCSRMATHIQEVAIEMADTKKGLNYK